MSNNVKKILFLRSLAGPSASNQDWGSLKTEVAANLSKDFSVTTGVFSELAFLSDGRHSRIWSTVQGWDLSEFDLVVFRKVGMDMEKAISAAHYLYMKKIPFTDGYLLTQGRGKLSGSFLRSAHNIPSPKTFYARPAFFKEIFKLDPFFEYPFILKADNGHKGRNNYLISSYTELCERLDASEEYDMVAQEYIENDGDLRVLVLNGEAKLAILRRAKKGSHLNNTSAGGKAYLFDIKKLQKKMLSDCRKATELERLQVAGVDLILDKQTGEHYILEVNRAPQLATGAFTKEKLKEYSKMLSRLATYSTVSHHSITGTPIGRAEYVSFPELDIKRVSAKVDTGADSSSIDAANVKEDKAGLTATILGKEVHFPPSGYSMIRVENSFGHREDRYKVKLVVRLKERNIRGTFTLSQRSGKTYQVLLGRRLLAGKFVVDVKAGHPQVKKERLHSKAIQAELNGSK